LRAKGKNVQTEIVHEVLSEERLIGGSPFAVLLADDFLTDYPTSIMGDFERALASSVKSQLSIMEVKGKISQITAYVSKRAQVNSI